MHSVFITDLDRCLADSSSDSVDNARPAFDALQSVGIPLILISRRTRAEIEPIRQRLHHQDPFIVEDGAAVFVPQGTFDFPLERSRRRSSYDVIELGTPYAMLRDVLRQVEETVKSPLRGFGDLTIEDIMSATGFSRPEAVRAKLREYDEPFLMTGPSSLLEEVARQITSRGLRCTRGPHFFHLTGSNSTTRAADLLLRNYRRKWGIGGGMAPVETVVIGEILSDFPTSLNTTRLNEMGEGPSAVSRVIQTSHMSPARWNHAVLNLLKHAA